MTMNHGQIHRVFRLNDMLSTSIESLFNDHYNISMMYRSMMTHEHNEIAYHFDRVPMLAFRSPIKMIGKTVFKTPIILIANFLTLRCLFLFASFRTFFDDLRFAMP